MYNDGTDRAIYVLTAISIVLSIVFAISLWCS